MPKGAKILCVQMQGVTPCLWAEVDTASDVEQRAIDIYGTGHPLPHYMNEHHHYIGTVQQGGFVWHVYEYTGQVL
jgi:hypothetical protein